MIKELLVCLLKSIESPSGVVGVLVNVNYVVLWIVCKSHLFVKDLEVNIWVEGTTLSVLVPLND